MIKLYQTRSYFTTWSAKNFQ